MDSTDILLIVLTWSLFFNVVLLWALYETRQDLSIANEVIDLLDMKDPHAHP